jgi:hypothetical protein
MKLDWGSIWQSIKDNRKVLLIIGGLALLLILGWYLLTVGETWYGNRQIDKLKANVNAALQDAANLKKEEANLEVRKVEANANVNAAVSDLQQQTFGHEQDKAETNKALANFNKAMVTNGDINRTAEDLKRQAERLGNQ